MSAPIHLFPKKLILIIGVFNLLSYSALAQQSFTQRLPFGDITDTSFSSILSNYIENKKAAKEETIFKNLPSFGLYGIGNLNTAPDFEAINGAGKLAGFIRPYIDRKQFATIYFAFNKNASNTDTLLASTFLFPDVGQSSFAGTFEWAFMLGKPQQITSKGNRQQLNVHLMIPFYEFANKAIKGKVTKTSEEELRFETLTHTIGFRYQFSIHRYEDDVSFGLSPYLAFINVPNEDNKQYRNLFGYEKLPSTIKTWGIKAIFQYNDFQVFADFRNVYNIKGEIDNEKVRSIQGFNSNIGFIFNAAMFTR